MTSYLTLIETMHVSCTFFELQRINCQKYGKVQHIAHSASLCRPLASTSETTVLSSRKRRQPKLTRVLIDDYGTLLIRLTAFLQRPRPAKGPTVREQGGGRKRRGHFSIAARCMKVCIDRFSPNTGTYVCQRAPSSLELPSSLPNFYTIQPHHLLC